MRSEQEIQAYLANPDITKFGNNYEQACLFYFGLLKQLDLRIMTTQIQIQNIAIASQKPRKQQPPKQVPSRPKQQNPKSQPIPQYQPNPNLFQCKVKGCTKVFDKKSALQIHEVLRHKTQTAEWANNRKREKEEGGAPGTIIDRGISTKAQVCDGIFIIYHLLISKSKINIGIEVDVHYNVHNINQNIGMATVQQILNEPDNYSEMSVDASFTLEDILQQPPDQEVDAFDNLQEIADFDAFFEDDGQPQPQMKNKKSSSNSELLSPAKQKVQIQSPKQQIAQIPSISQQLKPVQRWARLSNLPMPENQKIRNMVYIALKNVTQLFDITRSQAKGVGIPTCISTSGNKFLAIGTSIGNIVIFQVGVKGNRILSTVDQNKYGQTTSISISRDNRYIVAGYQTGLVILWDLYSFKVVKSVLLQKNKILKVLFCSQNYQNFVSSDSQGYIYMYTIQNYLWTGIKTQLLIDKSQNIYQDIKYSKVKSGRQILALSTLNSVLLVIMKPTVAILGSIQRPQGISATKIPNCEIGQSQQIKQWNSRNTQQTTINDKNKQDYVCVSWGRFIYVYTLVYTNSQIEKIQLDFIMEQPSGVHGMQFITSGILVTIDNRQVYRAINLQTERHKVTPNNKRIMSSNINTTQLQSETIYQRHLKDKEGKYIKSYSNTIVNCSYNPSYKEIFLISKNAVYRGRLQKWTDYVHYLLTQAQNWQLALKLCLQLYKGNFNIFAQPFVLNKTTQNLLCDIGRIFFNQRIKQLQGKRTQLNSIEQVQKQAQQLFQIAIQYFTTIHCQDYMFETIYKKLKDVFFFKYWELFVNSLQPFIDRSLISKVPSREIFVTIIDQFSDKPQLLNKFIMGLHKDFIYFQDIVEICTREKLFQSLSYICSVNNDFISPANKLIAHMQTTQSSTASPYFQTLKTYLTNLLDFQYPNNKPLTSEKQKKKMLSDLSIWLVCDETLQYMTQYFPQDYLLMLRKLAHKLLENQQITQIPNLAQQILKNLPIIRKYKMLPSFIQLLMQLGLSYKIHYSKQIVKGILDCIIEVYQAYNSADLSKDFKYGYMVRVLEKYLLDPHDNVKAFKEQYQQKLIPKLNIWVRMTYKMLAKFIRQEILKQSPQLLRNQDPGRDASIGYLFENSEHYSQIIHEYEDLLVQWSPQLSLLYMIQSKQGRGIRQINQNVMKIEDQRLRYAVLRKILRLLRQKLKQAPNRETVQVQQILRASISSLQIPSFQPLINQLQSHLSNQILLFYISCICKYKKQKRVFYELIQNPQQYRNALNQIQPIVEKYGYRSCLGFIYEQQLKLREAFDQYKYVYKEYFQQNFKKLVMHQYCHGRFMARIFHIMLDLCFRIRRQEQWGILISVVLSPLQAQDFTSHKKVRIIDTIQSIYSKKSSKQHPFIQHLIDIIQLTLTSMSRQVSIELMAIQLNKYTNLLNKQFIVNCLSSTLKGCGKRVETFEISRKLMVSQFVNQFETFFKINKIQGATTDNICDQCQLQASSRLYNPNIQQIKFQVLKCGHGYHSTCYHKNYYKCKICTRKAYGDEQQDINKDDKIKIILKKGNTMLQTQVKQVKEVDQSISHQIYRYLALDDYRKREEDMFQNFVQQYQGYIASYKNL